MEDDERSHDWLSRQPGRGDTPPDGLDSVQAPVRVCRKCSTQSQTAGDFCPHCGTAFVRRRPFARVRGTRRRTKIAAALVLTALVAGGVVGVVLKNRHDDQVAAEKLEKQKAAAQAEADRLAAEEQRKREAEEAQSAIDEIALDGRKDLERGLRKEVKKDAQEKVASGLLDGPILSASCDPVGGGRDDLTASTGKYECIAVHTDNGDGTVQGYRYSGTINYDEFSYTWQLGG